MKLPVRCLISVLVLCLAFLHTTHAAACTNTFVNLTTCAAFNGQPADGDGGPARAKYLQLEVARLYDADPLIDKNDVCKALFYTHHCLINGQGGSFVKDVPAMIYTYSAPCAADGTRIRSPCFESCLEFHRLCYFGMVLSQRSEICNTQAAPRASNVCFGDNAALGMKAFTTNPSAAPALAASTFLAPLALFVAFSVGIS
jgi:hypothetical protein